MDTDTVPAERTTIAAPPPPIGEVFKVGRIDPALTEEVRRRERGEAPNYASGWTLPPRGGDREPVALTPAMQRLQEMRAREDARSGPRIETREYSGESWHFLRLDYAPLQMARYDVARATGKGAVTWIRGATKAAIQYCVCKGEDDPTLYFSESDLEAYLSEPASGDIYALIKWLELQAIDINPDIYPKVEKEKDSPAATSPSSTSPQASLEADGSETPSSESVG